MDLQPVVKALELLKVEEPASLFAQRMANAFPGEISTEPVKVSLADLLRDMTKVWAELLAATHNAAEQEELVSELTEVFVSLAKPYNYPAQGGRTLQAGIVANFVADWKTGLGSAEFSPPFVALVRSLA
jgi:hypothetical protein